ncbi:MAG: DUF4286 family protein [Mycobacterium sp.]
MADRFVQVVFSNPVAGQEDEFNDWYDTVHIPELLTVPGMLSATRYALHEAAIYHVEGGVVPEHTHMCVYEMEGDVDAIMGKIRQAVADGRIHMSDSLDLRSSRLSFWTRGNTFTA